MQVTLFGRIMPEEYISLGDSHNAVMLKWPLHTKGWTYFHVSFQSSSSGVFLSVFVCESKLLIVIFCCKINENPHPRRIRLIRKQCQMSSLGWSKRRRKQNKSKMAAKLKEIRTITTVRHQFLLFATFPPIPLIFLCHYQRWASTLANRSNARHRPNIRAPHAPYPQIYVPKVWESV